MRALVRALPKHSQCVGQGLQLGHAPARRPSKMLEEEMSTGSQLLARELNAEPNMRFRLLELDRELIMPFWCIHRRVKILEVAKLMTKEDTYH